LLNPALTFCTLYRCGTASFGRWNVAADAIAPPSAYLLPPYLTSGDHPASSLTVRRSAPRYIRLLIKLKCAHTTVAGRADTCLYRANRGTPSHHRLPHHTLYHHLHPATHSCLSAPLPADFSTSMPRYYYRELRASYLPACTTCFTPRTTAHRARRLLHATTTHTTTPASARAGAAWRLYGLVQCRFRRLRFGLRHRLVSGSCCGSLTRRLAGVISGAHARHCKPPLYRRLRFGCLPSSCNLTSASGCGCLAGHVNASFGSCIP